jgi:prevent-host-death family protein
MQVSIREMKNSLSRYLKLVQAGRHVVITDRGKPVAQLVPAPESPADAEQDELRRILALPWIRPGSGRKVKGSKRPIVSPAGEKTLSEMVLEDRG